MSNYNFQFLDHPIPIIEQNWDQNVRPYVHVWLQTYNHENYIRNSIEGVLEQVTRFPIKILIHDDASTDKTSEIIKEYEIKYPQLIKAFYQKINTHFLKNSDLRKEYNSWRVGKYEAPCEGDDYWIDKFKLQKQVDLLEKNNSDFIYTDLDIYYQTKNKRINNVFKTGVLKDYKTAEEFIINCGYKAPCTWLYNKAIYDEIPNSDLEVVDQSFIIMAYAMLNKKVSYLNSSTAVYRILDNSLTHTKELLKIYNRELELISIQKKYINYFDKSYLSKLQRAAFVRLFFMELALFPKEFSDFLSKNINIAKDFVPNTKREILIKILIPTHHIFSGLVRTFFKINKYSF
jgi:glycosyltransferase involved in cell wall biosynthesis